MSLNREHSKVRRDPPFTKHQTTKYVPIRVRVKRSMYVHAGCVPIVFLEHGALVACLHLKCLTIYFTTSVLSFQSMLFVSERIERNRCTGIQQQQYSSSVYEYVCCR